MGKKNNGSGKTQELVISFLKTKSNFNRNILGSPNALYCVHFVSEIEKHRLFLKTPNQWGEREMINHFLQSKGWRLSTGLVLPWKTLFTSVYERRKGGPFLLSSSFSLAWTKMAFKFRWYWNFCKASQLIRICKKKNNKTKPKNLSTQLDIHFLRRKLLVRKLSLLLDTTTALVTVTHAEDYFRFWNLLLISVCLVQILSYNCFKQLSFK